MKNVSLKALGATIFAAGLVVAGVASPAAAVAALNLSSNSIATSTATSNGFYMELTGATMRNDLDTIVLGPPNGWSLVNTCVTGGQSGNESTCNITSVTIGGTPVTGWRAGPDGVGPKIRLYKVNAGTGFNTGDTIKVTFSAGAWTSPASSSSSTFSFTTMYMGGGNIETATSAVTVGTPSYTVTFNGNGSTSGNTVAQTASTATALTSNGFSKSGSTFAGWNTAANGSGTAYANGASYPFTSATTLYAQWTTNSSGGSSNSGSSASSNLANTGVDSAAAFTLLAGGLSLALVGAEMFMIARRKRSN